MYLEDDARTRDQFRSKVCTISVHPLFPGALGTWQTLWIMATMVRGSCVSPVVKDAAVRLTAGSPAGNRGAIFQRLYDSLRNSFRYVSDTRSVEEVWQPDVHADRYIALGYTWGDCDDLAVFSTAVARAVGFVTRLVAISNGKAGTAFNHVFGEALVNNEWRSLDFLSPNSPRLRVMTWRI